jgi:UDP-N-acetylglucosamine--N-acetylmuramyl-(pentapeptide) pyrophosphoryl-undecaprenol N-acetylglucosamine transferase
MASYLFVSSGGGHLKEMFALAGLLGIDPAEQHWATVDSALSRTLLSDRRVTHLADPPPRAVVPVLRNAMIARSLLSRGSFDAVFSTGASPALSFLPLAASRGIPAHYIESAARVLGPSVTGRILARIPAVSVYTQYRTWADDRWRFGGSIFDTYRVEEAAPAPIRRAVVSVGTQDGYPFPRFLSALAPLLEGVEVLWQTGANDVSHLGIEGRHSVPHDELNAAMAAADVVIAHGGVGTSLSAIEQGRVPILVPRRAAAGEHVDDHQVQIATRLAESGLAVTVEVEGLSRETLELAAARRVVSAETAVPFVVQEAPTRVPGRSRRLFSPSR